MDTLPSHAQNNNPPLPNPGVYIIVNVANGSIYVGSSVNVKRRWNEHKSSLRRNKSQCVILQKAWNKYGEESFVFAVLQYLDNRDDLSHVEQKYIDELNPEYNAQPQVKRPGPRIYSEETRAKISAALKGRTQPEEHKAYMREIMKGRVFTEDHRQNLKAAWEQREVTPEQIADFQERMNDPEIAAKRNAAIKGKKRTPEQRQKFSEAHAKEKGQTVVHLNTPEVIAKRNAAIAQYHADVAAGKRIPRITRAGRLPASDQNKSLSTKKRKVLSEEHKRKLSEAHKGKPSSRKGKTASPETRAKLSAAHKGKTIPRESVERAVEKRRGFKHTPESKEKLRQAHLGKRHSEETKEKLRQINLGKEVSEETRAKLGAASKRKHQEKSNMYNLTLWDENQNKE